MTAQFSVSISFLDNLLRLNRTSDLLTALPARDGSAPHLDPLGSLYLKAYLVQQPDATYLRVGQVGKNGPLAQCGGRGRVQGRPQRSGHRRLSGFLPLFAISKFILGRY